MTAEYGAPPAGVKAKLEPFTISFPEDQISAMKELVRLSPLGPATYENGKGNIDGSFGVTRSWMEEVKDAWLNQFSWRQHEEKINSFPNFKTVVRDDTSGEITIHFVALFSKNPKAVPVIFMHGWPGSFLEFIPMLSLLRDKYTPDTLPFHVIVPSLPGYCFSSGPPTDASFRLADCARTLNQLMIDLGFGDGYVAEGGDIGAFLAHIMVRFPECKAAHVNLTPIGRKDMSAPGALEGLEPRELTALQMTRKFMTLGRAYAEEHATRPATIGFVLSSSPVALLAWVGEKFLEWSHVKPSTDTILSFVTLWWLTSTFPRAIYPYRDLMLHRENIPTSLPEGKPFGYTAMWNDGLMTPKSWLEGTGVIYYGPHDKGAHFAALENPTDFLTDVEDFVVKYRTASGDLNAFSGAV